MMSIRLCQETIFIMTIWKQCELRLLENNALYKHEYWIEEAVDRLIFQEFVRDFVKHNHPLRVCNWQRALTN